MKRFLSGAVFLLVLNLLWAANAGATFLLVYWPEDPPGSDIRMTIRGANDPEADTSTLFSSKYIGPNEPPSRGGVLVLIDVTDRSRGQLSYFGEIFGDGMRYVLKRRRGSEYIFDHLYTRGFIVTTWDQIRGMIWDRQLGRTLEGVESRSIDDYTRLFWHCKRDCDAQACAEAFQPPPAKQNCECEEWQGRVFCHRKDLYRYSAGTDSQ